MQKANTRTVTVHIPDTHKPPRERCSGAIPQCSINHYVTVPAISLRGTWQFEDMAHIPGKN